MLLSLLGILLLHLAVQQGGLRLLLLPPILANAVLLYLFGRSLLPGREALITGFHRFIHGSVTPTVARYTRRLTFCWVAFFAVSLFAVVYLAHAPELTSWSWSLSVLLPAAAAIFFLAEHLFRARYRRHYGVVPLWVTLRELRHPEAWRAPSEGIAAKR